MTAATSVFDITELAKMIFLKLPVNDLLVDVPRVCKLWHSIVASSTKLQKALFLLPSGPIIFARPKNGRSVEGHPGHQFASKDIAQNPWLKVMGLKVASATTNVKRAALFAPEASWRRMFISQPPHARSEFVFRADGMYDSSLFIYPSHSAYCARWLLCYDASGIELGLGLEQFTVDVTPLARAVTEFSERLLIPINCREWKNVRRAEQV